MPNHTICEQQNMRIVAPRMSELQTEMPHSTIIDRRWGLSALKSAYAEMYPDCQLQFIEEISKRIEQGVFTKTSSSWDYQKTIKNTASAITTLAEKTARNDKQRAAQESVVVGAMHVPQNGVNQSSVGKNQGRRSMTPGPYSLPDPSDVVNLVPFILEAGVQVLGKIETAQQLRALDDGQRSTIGFLAFEKLSKFAALGGRGLGDSSKVAHQSLGRNNMRNVQFNGVNNRVVHDFPQSNTNHGATKAAPSMTFAELKAKYKEKMEILCPLIETHFRQKENRETERSKDLELQQIIAFVRAGLSQDNVTNPDALQSLETLSVRILGLFGHLLGNEVFCKSNESEKYSDEDSLSSQSFKHHPQDSTDCSVDLGETDSDTEDDEDEEDHPETQSHQDDYDTHDPEKHFERQGDGINDDGRLNENEHQEYTWEEGEILEDDLKEHEFADTFFEEILAQQQLGTGSSKRNSQESKGIKAEPGMMPIQDSEVNHQLELLLETISEQQAEPLNSFGLEPIPFAGNQDTAKDESGVENNIQEPRKEERKITEGQASANLEDSSVPGVTPRRSNRIRSKDPVASRNENLTGRNTAYSAKNPPSKKATPANTPRTRKTPRRTPRKTPLK